MTKKSEVELKGLQRTREVETKMYFEQDHLRLTKSRFRRETTDGGGMIQLTFNFLLQSRCSANWVKSSLDAVKSRGCPITPQTIQLSSQWTCKSL